MAGEQRLEFETTSGEVDPGTIALRWLRGREWLSQPYEYELELEVEVEGGLGEPVLEDLLRRPCRVCFGSDADITVHGILTRIELPTTRLAHPVTYRATMVPKLWIASQVRRSRVFQELDVRGIVKIVLEELGLEEGTHFGWHQLSATYPVSEYTVQYQESDLDFLHRLLERAGIFYMFAQEQDGEVIVFADDNAACQPLTDFELVQYTAGAGPELVGVLELSRTITPQPTMVLLRDYNWRTPAVQLQSEAAADDKTGRGFVNEYGQHFKDPAEGAALARVRAQELMVGRDHYEGLCRIAGLLPGHRLEISGHPLVELDQEYLVTSVVHEADGRAVQDAGALGYDKRFTAIPYAVPYRPPRRTAKPKIEGVMHARVDGEVPGTAAPIDEYGRYRILFPFDLVGQPGGKATRWVRLAQPASGAGYGIHFPLHIGAEVAVAHIDGDPDRPIIMNSPPNSETVTPVNDTNPTQSQIITQTGIRMTWDDDC